MAMAKMNHWRAGKLYQRQTLDHRFEFDADLSRHGGTLVTSRRAQSGTTAAAAARISQHYHTVIACTALKQNKCKRKTTR
jgi:hypothetical protein